MSSVSIDLPQIVPGSRCLQCDVCCRFPDHDSPLRPYFTETEIAEAVAAGLPAHSFPDRAGSRITLVHHPAGEGYLCPAFDVATSRCTIYPVRPLDCRLYPFALMRPPQGEGLLLGWDRLCPYLREESDPLLPVTVSPEIAQRLKQPDAQALLTRHPNLIGEFQETVWVLEPVSSGFLPQPPPPSPVASPTWLRAIDAGDSAEIARLHAFLSGSIEAGRSSHHPAALLMWRSLMRLFWVELDDGLGVAAEQSGGYFAPVPPAPASGGRFVETCRQLLELLNRLNRNPAASRIEQLSDAQQRQLTDAGFLCQPVGEEYLYDRRALAELRGDRYKSHRWSCNQAERRFHPVYDRYQPDDHTACLRLYAKWRRQKERRVQEDGYRDALLADSVYAHWQLFTHAAAWGLTARVVRVQGEIRAYTVGAPLDDRTMVVLLEVADPDDPGLGPWLFREWCREFTDYSIINAMDDSDLSSLRAVKVRYRPMRTIPFYQAIAVSDGGCQGESEWSFTGNAREGGT